jgi:predicted nucleotidyltransferase component of viral defense system
MLHSKGILSTTQKRILLSFSKLKDSASFNLTGGTALSEFYLGHRRSFDLDLFTSEKGLILPFSRTVEDALPKQGFSVKVIHRFHSFVEFEIGEQEEKVRLQLALDSPFRFKQPENSDIGIMVNDFQDLVVDKFLAFFSRAEPRDALDLFFILKTKDLKELLKLASKKDPGFDLYWLAISLKRVKDFPEEIERWPVEMILSVNATDIKNLFSSLVLEIMDDIKKNEKI